MNLHCPQFENDLTAYLHGELSPLRRVLLRRHLSGCKKCREDLETMKRISTTLKESEAPGEPFNANLRERILSNLPAASETVPASRAVKRYPVWMWGLSAATVCVLAAMLFPVFSRSRENARRVSSMSSLKELPLGLSNATNADATSAGATAPSAEYPESVSKSLAQRQETSRTITTEESEAGNIVITPYRRVHKEGSLTVEVPQLEQSSDAVETMIQKAGGFVANNELNTQADGLKTAALEIRVPVKQFDAVMKEIAALGEVKAKRVQGQDITAKVSDADQENNILATDLRQKWREYNAAKKRAAEKKKNNPNDWQQRTEIRRMRVELAQVRACLELLKKMSDYANLSVRLQEKPKLDNGGGFLGDIGNTGRAAFDSLLLAARLPVNLLIYLLAYSPLWLPLLLVWRYFLRTHPRGSQL